MPAAGEVIAGKYQVERVLGAGGMGVVLCARHLQLGQRVALKFMRGQWALDPNSVNRFLREARAAAAIANEHVTKVLDVGTLENGAPYMVMEFLAGTDLGEQVRVHGPMPVADAVAAVLQAGEALAEAHALGIVHRDLKPSNLFLSRTVDGSPLVKVLDFGISKMSDPLQSSGHSLTASGSVMGSPGYMSPEQVRSAKDVDPRSDIWAVGVILYELLTAVAPFRGDTLGETFARILTEPPAPIRTLRPDVPEALAAVIAQCLERDLTKRVQNVGELAARLAPFAPPAARVSVDRILRIAGKGGAQPGRVETMMAPGTMGPDGPGAVDARSGPGGTDASWQRSNAAGGGRPQRSAGERVAIAVGVAVILAGGVGIYFAGAHFASAGRANASPSAAAPATTSPPPPPQQAAATLAPVPTAPPEPEPVKPPIEAPSASSSASTPPTAPHPPPGKVVVPHAGPPPAQHPAHAQDPSIDDLLERRQ